jgi:diguanylate cyclase (GGDEF)-like protein
MNPYASLSIFLLMVFLNFSLVHAQENDPRINIPGAEQLSSTELLNQAKAQRNSDPELSSELAQKALDISEQANDHLTNAQAHAFLGSLAHQAENIDQSMHHYLQASIEYEKLNDEHNQISSTLEYAALFFEEKRFSELDTILDTLLPIAQKYGDELSIASTLTTKGDSAYAQQRYADAAKQFNEALLYLSDDKKSTKSRLASTHHKIAQSQKRLKNHDEAALAYLNALSAYTALQDPKAIARTLNNLATIERHRGDNIKALDYAIRGLALRENIDDPEGQAKAFVGAGIIYRLLGRYEKSLDHIHQAHLYYKSINDVEGLVDTSNQMGLIYTRLKRFDQAKSFYQLTIDLPIEKVAPLDIAIAYREMAVIELNFERYESAKGFAEKAFQIYRNENKNSKSSIVARIIGNIYREIRNNEQAIAYYRQSLAFAKEDGNKLYQIKAQTQLAVMLLKEDVEQAIVILTSSLQLAKDINNYTEQLYAYRALRQAEKLRDNISESLNYAEAEIALIKLIQTKREENELVREKADKKNDEIEISKQANQIAELELYKNRFTNTGLAVLLAICMLAVILIYRRFVDSRKLNIELDYLAARDPLTNCYNRRILFELMDRDFSKFTKRSEYCVIMADIDLFKDVNDTHGHSAGDKVLCGVANILQNGLRQDDIAARYGGEEFCMVLAGTTDEIAKSIAEKIRKEVASSRFNDISVTCSFGISSIRNDATSPSELIDQADLALYKSKMNGRNQVTLWDESLGGKKKSTRTT